MRQRPYDMARGPIAYKHSPQFTGQRELRVYGSRRPCVKVAIRVDHGQPGGGGRLPVPLPAPGATRGGVRGGWRRVGRETMRDQLLLAPLDARESDGVPAGIL